MWQTKYALAVTKNLGVGVNFGLAVKASVVRDQNNSICIECIIDLALVFL